MSFLPVFCFYVQEKRILERKKIVFNVPYFAVFWVVCGMSVAGLDRQAQTECRQILSKLVDTATICSTMRYNIQTKTVRKEEKNS